MNGGPVTAGENEKTETKAAPDALRSGQSPPRPQDTDRKAAAAVPVLHDHRDGWDFTALFSNTGLAHQLDRTGDWVVIYYHSDAIPESQCTAVTENRRGPLFGRRVVRGRETECREYYGGSHGT